MLDVILSKHPTEQSKQKEVVNFVQKYTKKSVLTESALRNNYLVSRYEDALRRVSYIFADNKMWVSVFESTDVDKRHVSNVVAGTSFASRPGFILLLHSEALEKGNNNIHYTFRQSNEHFMER
jgi:hypothetical protein